MNTTFAELGDWSPTQIDGAWGAVRWWYRELHYFGAPGGYRYYVFEVSDCEPPPAMSDFLRQYSESQVDMSPSPSQEVWERARSATVIEAYGVYDAELDLTNWPNAGP